MLAGGDEGADGAAAYLLADFGKLDAGEELGFEFVEGYLFSDAVFDRFEVLVWLHHEGSLALDRSLAAVFKLIMLVWGLLCPPFLLALHEHLLRLSLLNITLEDRLPL